jgi:hypothetical protein
VGKEEIENGLTEWERWQARRWLGERYAKGKEGSVWEKVTCYKHEEVQSQNSAESRRQELLKSTQHFAKATLAPIVSLSPGAPRARPRSVMNIRLSLMLEPISDSRKGEEYDFM